MPSSRAAARARTNRILVLLYTGLSSASRSIWAGDVFAAYVYLVTDSAEAVGVITGVRGIAQLLLAPLCGWLGDRWRRDGMLRVAALVGYAGAALAAFAVHRDHFLSLSLSMGFWGCYWAVANPNVDALYADSVADGERALWFTRKNQVNQLANACGPLLTIAIFALRGNSWALRTCQLTLYAGIGSTLLPNTLLFALRDVRVGPTAEMGATPALRAAGLAEPLLDVAAAEGAAEAEAEAAAAPPPAPDAADDAEAGAGCGLDGASSSAELSALASSSALGPPPASPPPPRATSSLCCGGRVLLVPALVLGYDVAYALASGLSTRFFPIFLLEELALSPVAVNAIGVGALVLIALASSAAERAAPRAGRIGATGVCVLLGCAACFGMVGAYQAGASKALVVALYLVRTALVTAPAGLTKSIIHDLVPPAQRGRYAAVDSVNQATFSGSATVGGLIIARSGIGTNFYATATLQALALAPLALASTYMRAPRARRAPWWLRARRAETQRQPPPPPPPRQQQQQQQQPESRAKREERRSATPLSHSDSTDSMASGSAGGSGGSGASSTAGEPRRDDAAAAPPEQRGLRAAREAQGERRCPWPLRMAAAAGSSARAAETEARAAHAASSTAATWTEGGGSRAGADGGAGSSAHSAASDDDAEAADDGASVGVLARPAGDASGAVPARSSGAARVDGVVSTTRSFAAGHQQQQQQRRQ